MKFLSGRSVLTALVLLLLFGACGTVRDAPPDDLAALYAEGVLLPYDPALTVGMTQELYTLHRGDLIRRRDIPAHIFFPVQSHMYFEQSGEYFSGVLAEVGQQVYAGDLLATLSFEPELLEIERLQLLFQIEHAAAVSDEEALRRRLKEVDDLLAGHALYAPHDGIITYVHTGEPGPLSGRPRIATVTDDSTVLFYLDDSPLYVRFGDELIIEALGEFPQRFSARVVTDPLVLESGGAQMRFLLAPGEDFTANLSLGTVFRAYPYFVMAYDALLIHRRALHSEGTRRFVYVYDDGRLQKRYVTLGATLGTAVQILTGLEEGQRVVLP
jgi:multidrug efflux pump subunit AcrA (membrane-fusion protein)